MVHRKVRSRGRARKGANARCIHAWILNAPGCPPGRAQSQGSSIKAAGAVGGGAWCQAFRSLGTSLWIVDRSPQLCCAPRTEMRVLLHPACPPRSPHHQVGMTGPSRPGARMSCCSLQVGTSGTRPRDRKLTTVASCGLLFLGVFSIP